MPVITKSTDNLAPTLGDIVDSRVILNEVEDKGVLIFKALPDANGDFSIKFPHTFKGYIQRISIYPTTDYNMTGTISFSITDEFQSVWTYSLVSGGSFTGDKDVTDGAILGLILGKLTFTFDAFASDLERATVAIFFDSTFTDINTTGIVLDTLFNANTILKADVNDTPEALSVVEQRLIGRITSGEIAALTAAQVNTLLANVLKADFNAQTILAATTDDTPAALTVAEDRLIGRIIGGNVAALTPTNLRTFLEYELWRAPQSGEYTAGLFQHDDAGSQAPGADVLYAVPIVIPIESTFTDLCVRCSIAQAGSNARVGVYEDSSGNPGALIEDVGAFTPTATGYYEVTFSGGSRTFGPGYYWLVILCDHATPAFATSDSAGCVAVCSIQNSNVYRPVFFAYRSFSYAALPDPFGSATRDDPATRPIRLVLKV